MRRFVSLVSATALAFAFAASTPQVAEASCSQAQVNLYRDANFAGGGLAVCYGSNISNLADYGFDDTTSSARFYEWPTKSVNTTVCLYTYPGYVGLIKKFTTDGQTVSWNWWNGDNDQTSSVKFDC